MKKLLLLLSIALLGMAAVGIAAENSINVKGSDTMVVLGQKWAEVYMSTNPTVKIQITGGGSGTGLAALQNNQVDIANSSRSIKPKEVEQCIKTFHRKPVQYVVALDGLSIYVNENNKIDTITFSDLRDIFTGKITNWKQLGGNDCNIVAYSRENSSGTYEFFKEHVLNGADFAANVQTLAGTAQIIQSVAMDKTSIGYGGAAYAKGVKQLKVAKTKEEGYFAPTEENVMTGKYPIWRNLYIYVNPDLDKGDVHKYIDWIKSDAGQSVVKTVGYYPIPANIRTK
jgi:phosphate transport system substrate-binding protein